MNRRFITASLSIVCLMFAGLLAQAGVSTRYVSGRIQVPAKFVARQKMSSHKTRNFIESRHDT